LIDEFTIIEQGRGIMTMEADSARERFQKIRARFAEPLPLSVPLPGALDVRRDGRQIELLATGPPGLCWKSCAPTIRRTSVAKRCRWRKSSSPPKPSAPRCHERPGSQRIAVAPAGLDCGAGGGNRAAFVL